MAAPPPQGETDEPDIVAFGIAVVDDEIDDGEVSFPADRREIIRALGNPDIPYDSHGRSIPLSEAIEKSGRTTFEDRRDFLNSLHPVFEAERASGGFGDWVRSILPF